MPSFFVKLKRFKFENRRARAWATIPRLRTLAASALVIIAIALAWYLYIYYWSSAEIIVDGKKITTHHRTSTVGKLLQQERVALGEKDIVLPPLSEPLPRGEAVIVIRVTEKIEKVDDKPVFCVLWQKRNDKNLRPVALQKGIMKQKHQQVRIIRHDGAEKERQVVKEWQTKKMLYRLALLDDNDRIEKVYELPGCKKINMIATAYYPGDPLAWRDGTITFLGLKMQRGIVAVDPKVIPLRTRVYVPGFGYGFAADTGSAIKGKRIDLGVNNAKEEKSFMHKPVTVYILEKADSW